MKQYSGIDIEHYIKDNNLEESLTYDSGEDYIARDLSCPCGKDVYRTFSDAEKMLKQRGKRGDKKIVYKCEICGYFHISTKTNHTGIKRNRYDRKYTKARTLTAKDYTKEDIDKAKKFKKEKVEQSKRKRVIKIGESDETINGYFKNSFSELVSEETLNKLKNLK